MEQGLAQQMVYGSGESQNTKHYYVNTDKKKKKYGKKPCKTKKKVV